jgi:hypothetical protein
MKHLIALAACAAATFATAATDPARLEEARLLIRAMQVEKQMDRMTNGMASGMARDMAEMSGNRDPRVARIAMEETSRVVKQQVTRQGGVLETIIQATAEEFTVEEMRQARAFHESPVGRKMLEVQPRIMQRVMSRSDPREIFARACSRVRDRLAQEKIAGGEAMQCEGPPQ